MSTKNTLPADALAHMRQEIKQRTEIVRTVNALQEEIAFDRICGSWLSAENNLTAAIRRIGPKTYRLLVFDHSLCYRRLVQDAVIAPESRTLVFGNIDDPRDINIVEYNAADEVLTLGCYGRFVAEDSIPRYGYESMAAEESPFTEEEA
ncbi:MAG: hypothetical protein NC226_07320 [Bacteroides cellulosilyticus]|nr:hypothetical protein [Bacteroides cellulosilyticus]